MTELSPETLALLPEGFAQPKKAGPLQTIGAVAGLTVIALLGGSALGFLLKKDPPPPAPAEAVSTDPVTAAVDTPTADLGPKEIIQPIEPILTDLSSPVGTQVRLEASLVMKVTDDEGPDQALLASQVQADTVVFLRTLELAQIEGARGLLHLKEDLLERARLRSSSVSDIIVRALIVK
ncbi:flagellar basal body protein FliL [Aureimonas sp. ME7]|uniref:flagellar basal body protein FliL n=1 Tax=Aureimonas sp. ME7 TaxID=2744252 RepID=UPI0015F565D8|nr:flagellar basal body protein FliL [Aureimonas sp. ME7]